MARTPQPNWTGASAPGWESADATNGAINAIKKQLQDHENRISALANPMKALLDLHAQDHARSIILEELLIALLKDLYDSEAGRDRADVIVSKLQGLVAGVVRAMPDPDGQLRVATEMVERICSAVEGGGRPQGHAR